MDTLLDALTRVETQPQTPREWVLLARLLMSGVDSEVVNLETWRSRNPDHATPGHDPNGWTALRGCGTIACAAGHLINHSAFRAAGLTFDPNVGPMFPTEHRGGGAMAEAMGLPLGVGDWLFGPVDADERIAFRQKHGWAASDKDIFLARCDRWLADDDNWRR